MSSSNVIYSDLFKQKTLHRIQLELVKQGYTIENATDMVSNAQNNTRAFFSLLMWSKLINKDPFYMFVREQLLKLGPNPLSPFASLKDQ